MYSSRWISILLKVPVRMNFNSYLLFGCLRYSQKGKGKGKGKLGGLRRGASQEELLEEALSHCHSLDDATESILNHTNV
jgi:hypothetical protein